MSAFLVSADYTQIELRFLAVLSGSVPLLEAYRQGQDVHLLTAKERYSLPPDQITRQMRNMA